MVTRNIRRAVLTGPTGAIGIALCEELAAAGIEVYAVCRPGSHRATAIPKHEKIVRVDCDVTELAKLPNLIPHGVDAFYHFAWAHTTGAGRNDMPAQIDNIRYTIEAVHAAKALGCQIFVGAGSQAEYGRVEGTLCPETPCFPENGYGIAKHCAGKMSSIEALKLEMDHVWVRILSVYGPGDGPNSMIPSVIRQLLEGKKPALTAGIQKWDYLYSGDAARAFRLVAEYGQNGKTYVLGSGVARPLKEYIEILRNAVDPTLPLGLGEILYGPQQVMHLEADITELRNDTGFCPQIVFEEGIDKTIESIEGK